MTKEEIKRAIKCCFDYSCVGCPNAKPNAKIEDLGCIDKMLASALNLINEQEKEIKQLKDEKKQAKIDVLNKVKERAVGLAAIETYHICNLIDKIIKEVQNAENKG